MLVLTGCGTEHPGTRGPAQALSKRQQQILHTLADEERATVALIDGGVDETHPSPPGVISSSWTAPGLEDRPTLHATQLAGIIAGRQTGTFSGGLAQGARLLDAKALDAQGTGLPTDIAAALTWAGREDADVVVASFGLENDEPVVRRAVSALVARGVLVIAATGNGYGAFDMYPALYRGVLGVTAYDSRGQRLELANWRGADVAAPGDDIWAPTLGDGYAPVSGTSVATAMGGGIDCGLRRSSTLR